MQKGQHRPPMLAHGFPPARQNATPITPTCSWEAPLRSTPRLTLKGSGALEKMLGGMTDRGERPAHTLNQAATPIHRSRQATRTGFSANGFFTAVFQPIVAATGHKEAREAVDSTPQVGTKFESSMNAYIVVQ